MIKTDQLTDADLGRVVVYRDPFTDEPEYGRLKGWSAIAVFVVFKCNNQWHRWTDYTAQSCDPRTVDFTE